MGFRMQKWIYSQKPRRLFSRSRKRTSDFDNTGERNDFDVNEAFRDTNSFASDDRVRKRTFEKLNPYPFKYILKRIVVPFLLVILLLIIIYLLV